MNPPSDGDDIAAVTPLRRREAHLVAVPTVRDPLPAEPSVWDTGEPGEPPLRRSRQRRIRGALTIGWRIFCSRLAMPRSRPAAIATIVLACATAATAVVVNSGSRRHHPPPIRALFARAPYVIERKAISPGGASSTPPDQTHSPSPRSAHRSAPPDERRQAP